MNKPKMLLAALPLLAGMVQAQQLPDSEWRQANRQVAEFPRGHADVLKWEQAQKAPVPAVTDKPATLVLNSFAEGVQLAWQAHPELAAPLARLGRDEVDLLARGQWQTLSVQKLRKIEDAEELIELAHDSRKMLLTAMAIEQSLPYRQQALQTAEAAAELGARMARAGNWSKLQDARQQLLKVGAMQQWQRSQYEAGQSRATVLKSLQQWLRHEAQTVKLPQQMPPLPPAVLSEQDFRKRIEQVAPMLSASEQIKLRANAELAYSAYQTAHQLASSQQEMLDLRQLTYDETVLRYNGMLLNTWDLLAESRALAEARIDAIGTVRDFWLAEADLQLMMLGQVPGSFVSLAAGGSDGPAAAGH